MDGGDPGVRLVVAPGVPGDGFVPVAEMDSARTDLLWGSYRAAIKLTLVPGTCSSFFWVRTSTWSSSDGTCRDCGVRVLICVV